MQAVVIGVLLAIVLIGFGVVVQRRNRLPSVLAARPALSIDEIQRLFFSDLDVAPELFSVWWEEVADAFEVPPGLIRPVDRFGVELPFRSFFGTTDEDLMLRKTLREHAGSAAELSKLSSVEDFIRFLALARRGQTSGVGGVH
jgi:hypothetical protein